VTSIRWREHGQHAYANLLNHVERAITRVFDLKGSARSRYVKIIDEPTVQQQAQQTTESASANGDKQHEQQDEGDDEAKAAAKAAVVAAAAASSDYRSDNLVRSDGGASSETTPGNKKTEHSDGGSGGDGVSGALMTDLDAEPGSSSAKVKAVFKTALNESSLWGVASARMRMATQLRTDTRKSSRAWSRTVTPTSVT